MRDASDLWEKLDRVRDLPTLPAVAFEINRLIADEDSPVEAISVLIEKDLALSARLLKLVNSSFFGLSSQVASIRRAMVLLGSNQVRNAVYAVTVLNAVGRNGSEAKQMLRHSASVAAAAQFLALDLKLSREIRENAFTAGLLHDIGKFILWQYFPEMSDRMNAAAADETAASRAGTQTETITHAEVGAYLVRRWQLPEVLRDAIRYHHQPHKAKIDPTLAALIHVADTVVHRIEDRPETAIAEPLDSVLGETFESWRDAPQERLAQVAEQVEAAGHFFEKD